MTIAPFEHAHLGQHLKDDKPRVNVHTVVHGLVRLGTQRTFIAPRAVIVTEKKYPDVSMWQGEINWDVMHSKTDTIVIKEGQNEWSDPKFARNWAEAKARGMYRGAYRFYDGRISPGRQAEKMVRNLENDLPEMEFIMDWEYSYGGPFEGLANVVACMQRVEQLLPGIIWKFYTGYYWFIGNSNPITNASHYNYLKTKRLWLAWYANDPSTVRIPPPWTRLDDWQCGTPAEGLAYGAESVEIDMNYFNGTTEQFYERYGGNEPPDNGGPMPVDKHMQVTNAVSASLNIRTSGENLGAQNDLGSFNLLPGDVIHAIEINAANWVRFDKLYRNNVLTALPPSPTGQYWALEKDSEGIWLQDTQFTPPSPEPVPPDELPASWEVTQVAKNDAGQVLATYKGTLTKQ